MRRMGAPPAQPPGAHGGQRRPASAVLVGLLLMGALGIGAASGAVVDRLVPSSGTSQQRAVTSGVPGAGPRATAQGIPVGYAHTPEGAAEAVGNYLAALGGRLALDPAAARAALDQVADPPERSALESGQETSVQLDESLWGVASAVREGKSVVLTQTPIAYRVVSYEPQEATVELWLVTTVGVENRQRLAAFFGNATASVGWVEGDWRLQAIEGGSAAGDVIPDCLQTPTPTGGVPSKLNGFTPYGS
jgi:hypothetical protein